MKERSADNILKTSRWGKIIGWAFGGVLLIMFAIMFWLSREPDVFWVSRSADQDSTAIGFSTTDTLVRVAETLLDKPGGYLTNDKIPPNVFLDNIPSWEFGVLQQVRDLARIIRNDYSRSQSQSREDADVAKAEPLFFIDNESWMLPAAESEYRDAIKGFAKYRDRLEARDPGTQFYARADNLRECRAAPILRRTGSEWAGLC